MCEKVELLQPTIMKLVRWVLGETTVVKVHLKVYTVAMDAGLVWINASSEVFLCHLDVCTCLESV